MSTQHFRKYIDIINENSQANTQLDEGIMDMLKPYIQKAAKALMSKLDPETLQGLKQAYDQSGGDKDKMMALIGITKQDLAPLAKQAGTQEAGMNDPLDKVLFGTGTSLKSKVLTGVFNILPLVGILDLITGNTIGNALQSAGGSVLSYLFYIVSAVLIWGAGNYDFGDMDRKGGSNPPVGFTSDGS
jgi:hypothetical protein